MQFQQRIGTSNSPNIQAGPNKGGVETVIPESAIWNDLAETEPFWMVAGKRVDSPKILKYIHKFNFELQNITCNFKIKKVSK